LKDGEEINQTELELIDQIYLNALVSHTLIATPKQDL